LLGLSRRDLSWEGETENELLLAERFGTVFLIGLFIHFEVTMKGQNAIPPKQPEILGGLFKQLLH
jgi:hypothetical protein